jgi:protein SCO1
VAGRAVPVHHQPAKLRVSNHSTAVNRSPRKAEWLFWGASATAIATVAVALVLSRTRSGRTDLSPPILATVAEFALTNQNDQPVTLAGLRGQVWIADIIFTRCAGPCPILTQEMKSLQDALLPVSTARLVTLTTDPEFDTPPVMKKYGERFGADFNRWTFLTGTKKEIAALAIDSLKLTALPVKPEERQNPTDLFVHSTIFVVVDRQARLRGVFETTGEGVEWTKVQPAILALVRRLETEP